MSVAFLHSMLYISFHYYNQAHLHGHQFIKTD